MKNIRFTLHRLGTTVDIHQRYTPYSPTQIYLYQVARYPEFRTNILNQLGQAD